MINLTTLMTILTMSIISIQNILYSSLFWLPSSPFWWSSSPSLQNWWSFSCTFKPFWWLSKVSKDHPEHPDNHSNHPDDHTIYLNNHIDPTKPCRTVQKYSRLNRAKCLFVNLCLFVKFKVIELLTQLKKEKYNRNKSDVLIKLVRAKLTGNWVGDGVRGKNSKQTFSW